jgi:DNA-binding MarR family transcriptional regulator
LVLARRLGGFSFGEPLSTDAYRWALKQKGLHPSEKQVLSILAWHHNHETELCNPSVGLIVEETNLSRHGVINATKVLSMVGLITKDRKQNGKSWSIILHTDKILTKEEYQILTGKRCSVSEPVSSVSEPVEVQSVVKTGSVTEHKHKDKESIKETQLKEKMKPKPKQTSVLRSVQLTEEQEKAVTDFNTGLCSYYQNIDVVTTDADRKALLRILTDKRIDGKPYTLDDIHTIGAWLDKEQTRENGFKWLSKSIFRFSDLVGKIGSTGEVRYRHFYSRARADNR